MARALGFGDPSIVVGAVYGADRGDLSKALAVRSAADYWPRAFLFVGQSIRRKGVDALLQAYDALLQAYAEYRRAVDDPWELIVCGQGPLQSEVEATPGVRSLGFVQPRDLVSVLAASSVLVLPSRVEHMGHGDRRSVQRRPAGDLYAGMRCFRRTRAREVQWIGIVSLFGA